MKLFKTLLIIFGCTFALLSYAEDTHEADRQQLRDLLVTVETALNKQDISTLETLMDKNIIITFHDGSVVRGISEVRAYFNKMLGSSSPVLSSHSTKAEVSAPANFYGNIAIADGKAQDHFVFVAGDDLNIETLWTAVLLKENDTWKMERLHFSSSIFDNPLVKAAEKNALYLAGVISIISLLLGIGIGRLSRRKK